MEPTIDVTPAGSGFELLAEQWVPEPAEKVFPFFADAYNLERITPPFLGFHVRSVSTPQVGEGTVLRYRLRIHGIPVLWRSRIEEWQPPRRFVDRQLFGPYAAWHHTHDFITAGSGTLLRDTVRYRLRCAVMQHLPVLAWVHRDVRAIFAYRQQVIRSIFGAATDANPAPRWTRPAS
jgi:ligand-binding SRPBCC domain-containing protein